jgi:WD40 repeat protein
MAGKNRNAAPKAHEKLAAKNKQMARDAKVAPKVTANSKVTHLSDAHAKVGAASDDQKYMNKMYMGLSAADTSEAPQLNHAELEKMTEVAREKHLFLHEQATQAYHEEQARKQKGLTAMFQKEDKWAGMKVAEIIKEDPLVINMFRGNKVFKNANGLGVYSVCWNKSGTMLATTGHDRSVSLWRPHAVTGMPARKMKGHKAWTIQACFSPDDKFICVCSGDSMYIWDPSNGTLKAEWEAHDALINGCSWSPNNKYVISCSNDMTAKVWVAKTALSKGQKKQTPGHAHENKEPEFDDNGKEIKHHSEQGVPVEFYLPRDGERGHAGAVVKAAFSPEGDWVVTGGKDKLVILWNLKLKGTKDRVFRGHTDSVLNVSVNYDGGRIASVDNRGMVIVWDPKVETPVHYLDGHTDIVYACVWGKESKMGKGRLFTCGHDGYILCWDSYMGTVVGETKSVHKSWVTAADLDNTNLQLATVSMDPNSSLVLWQSLPPVPDNWRWIERVFKHWKRIKRFFQCG